ncbi:hypothetical protein DYB30_002170 [Aphanomyces astaci]|nr:hypothetical protein DYB38_009045 [Aphanomyces astaci]RHY75809.1 hypothetical protein DYB30_002170 [Aphanomyces astaci]
MEPPAKKPRVLRTHASTWPRTPLPPLNAAEHDIRFQWIDIGMYDGEPLAVNPYSRTQPIPGPRTGSSSIIRLTGVTEDGHSIMAHIHGFVPYFYASCPDGLKTSDCNTVREALDAAVKKNSSDAPAVQLVEIVEDKMSLYGYQFDKKVRLIKVYLSLPNFVPKLRTALESGITIPGFGTRSYQTYESNVPYILRFMIDQEIQGCNWVELPAATYRFRTPDKQMSLCQMEVDIVYLNMVSHAPVGVWGKLAPLRILSFDIECMGRTGQFPDADKDPVIQIANVVWEQGAEHPVARNVFVLGTCKPIVGAHVMEFESEGDMLEAWAAFVRQVDPDILTGYNIDNFDVPYLINRGKALKLAPHYNCWGRLKNTPNHMEKKAFQSAQYGKSDNMRTTMHGRTSFDMLPIIRRNQQLSSYSLNSVCATFLGQQKEDVPHGIISDLQRGTADDRHRLAVYCLKDAVLPLTLLQKLSYLVNYIEMARVTGVPLDFLIDRGQQIKVYSMLLRKCRGAGLVVPNLPRAGGGGDDMGYEGATVIEPVKAYYTVPIATLDFASLYPSIMQGYNLCYSTLVAPSDIGKLPEDAYQTSPSGDVFVRDTTKKGILPLILEELLSARKQAKRDMATAPDAMSKAVQNGRQLALKISANSVYGFTGANVGQLPCIPIASSVTAYGRDLLLRTREEVEKVFTVANGYKHNAEVIYGDTDSVMVKFGVDSVADAMPLAVEAAKLVSDIFPHPIKLEFEKVYFPYLLMNKKRYAGLLWTKPEKYDKLDTKGLETVRRDNCLLVRRMVESCLKKILIERNVDAAIAYTKHIISELLQNKIDISLLVITKGLSKSTESDDYKVKQAHTELAARMKKRDPGSAPVLGERIAYVIIDKGKNVPLYDKAEDPVFALTNNIPIDCDYYMSNQLQNPIERIFEPIIGLAKVKSDLFAGDHTRKRSKPGLVQNSGGMMNFAVKKLKCLGCKAPLSGDQALCGSCIEQEANVYGKQLSVVVTAEQQFARLWTQCQNCQGSLHQDVLCSSRDCPIFYKRIKVQKELGEAQLALDRFKYEW